MAKKHVLNGGHDCWRHASYKPQRGALVVRGQQPLACRLHAAGMLMQTFAGSGKDQIACGPSNMTDIDGRTSAPKILDVRHHLSRNKRDKLLVPPVVVMNQRRRLTSMWSLRGLVK